MSTIYTKYMSRKLSLKVIFLCIEIFQIYVMNLQPGTLPSSMRKCIQNSVFLVKEAGIWKDDKTSQMKNNYNTSQNKVNAKWKEHTTY